MSVSKLVLSSIFVLLPFMQVGISYWLAGHALLFGLLMISEPQAISKFLLSNNPFLRAAMAFGLILSTSVHPGSNSGDLIRATREAVCFFLIVGAGSLTIPLCDRGITKMLGVIKYFTISIISLTILQTFFLARGIYFGLPQSWFVINVDTLPDHLDLIYSRIRPMGTFGEPSYLAAVCISIMFGLSKLWNNNRDARLIVILLFVVILLSRSMSGILSASALMGFVIYKSKNASIISMFLLFGAACLMLVTSYLELEVFSRFNALRYGEDLSFLVRIVEPFRAIPVMLSEFPFGVPTRVLAEQPYISSQYILPNYLVQNGALKLVFTFGYLGLLALFSMLFLYQRKPAFLFLLFVLANQNGSFLSTDKVVLVSIGFLLWNSVSLHLNATEPLLPKLDNSLSKTKYTAGR